MSSILKKSFILKNNKYYEYKYTRHDNKNTITKIAQIWMLNESMIISKR